MPGMNPCPTSPNSQPPNSQTPGAQPSSPNNVNPPPQS
jgi:hypothetical protein